MKTLVSRINYSVCPIVNTIGFSYILQRRTGSYFRGGGVTDAQARGGSCLG